ncbi:MAG: choice-of-anchor J domain-containing protein, partial [bacterium]|nr:choice-of-anchor J domain-containing protein [Candidatus Limimorpha equi]
MTRKFTFLLMALLALAGFKSWGQETITVDFESGIPSGWTQIDANNDGYIWSVTTDAKHEGQYGLQSESYRGAIRPDNYFVSPQLTLGSGANIKFWADTFWGYPEHFGVFISTTGGTNAADFTDKVFEYTFNGSGFKEFSVDLDAYQGQQVYIAFRHYAVYNEYRVYIDDITIDLGETSQKYTVDLTQPEAGGTIDATPKTDVAAGTTVTLSANPAFGYEFGTWTVMAGEDPVTVTNNTFEMPESDVTVTATFNELTQYNITCSQTTGGAIHAEYNGETITSAPAGTVVTLVAEPNTGYAFGGWTVMAGETPVTVNTNNTFEMPGAAVTVSATFSTAYTVEIPTLTGGTITHMSTTPGQTAYAAGTDVYFFPSPEDGYEFVDNTIVVKQWDPINETWSIPVTVYYNSGMPRITMPAGNVQVSATFRRNKFNVTSQTIPAIGGSFQVSPTSLVAETAMVSITNITPNNGYQFASVTVTRNDTQASVTVSPYYDYYVFNMPNSDVTVTVTFKALPRYSVSLGTMQNGTITLQESYQNILAGTPVYLNANPATGYKLESITVTPEEGESFRPTQQYSYYYFTMPSSNVTISATFRQLQTYTINYYVNGQHDRTMQCQEDRFVNNDGPQNVAVPAGTTFEGWGVAEIGTYTTEKPAVLGDAESPTQNYDLYAVLSYSESVPATSKDGETWVEVTSPTDLSSGDQVIFVEKINSKVLAERTGEYDGCFRSANITISNNEISSIPSNAVVFEAESISGSWKFWFDDAQHPGLTTLTDYSGGYLVPMSMGWGGSDLWTIISNGSSVNIQGGSGNYIVYKSGDFNVDGSSVYKKSSLFKKYNPVITTNYYMTSVLTGGTVANATFKNIIVANPITVSGRLEMNAGGLFRNENTANFVFADGAQFYYTGEETVLATFQKSITGYTNTNDHYYLIANPTDNETVANLVNEE